MAHTPIPKNRFSPENLHSKLLKDPNRTPGIIKAEKEYVNMDFVRSKAEVIEFYDLTDVEGDNYFCLHRDERQCIPFETRATTAVPSVPSMA